MKVYLVILEDRHTDVQVFVYASREAALACAQKIVAEYDYDDDDPDDCPAEWLFTANLSPEGDAVRVEAADVQ